MGIKGLFKVDEISRAIRPCHVRKFSGCRVAVDIYGWMYKGAYSCATELGRGIATTKYVDFCLAQIDILLNYNIIPISVFDGRDLPSKAGTNECRRKVREEKTKLANEAWNQGKREEASTLYKQALHVTHAMALKLIKALRKRKLEYLVAPYESDAQLAYMSLKNMVDLVITEDSDLIVYGCHKIFFKFRDGEGQLFDKSKLTLTPQFNFIAFRRMCILSGCDYQPSLPSIGIATARRIMQSQKNHKIQEVIKTIPSFVRRIDVVPEKYIQDFIRAEHTYLYQLVYDTVLHEIVPLNPYEKGLEKEDLKFAGEYLEPGIAIALSLGQIHPISLETIIG